jgi:hypothetical protein
MRPTLLIRCAPALLLAGAIAACGDDETAPEEHHTPASARVFVGEADASENLVLTSGESLRVEIRFYDDEDEEITGIADEHFASLTFTPETLAEVADVNGEHFQKEVTGGSGPVSGTYTIGYGHDADADELTFGPFGASLVIPGGAIR